MRKKLQLLILFVIFGIAMQSNAQTLQPGDIVVIGIGSDTGPPPPNVKTEFSWVPLVNLNAGTQFYFTDAGWNTQSNEFMGTGLTDEILLRYTVPSGGILAGTVMTVSENGTSSDYTVLPGTKCGSDTDGKISLPNAGDEIIVFRSTATVDANFPGTNFTAIFAVTTSTTDWTSLNTTTALTTQAFKDNYSNLPPGLTNGTNAVAVGIGPGVSDEADNARYEGNTSGSKAVLLQRVCTLSQWKRYDVGSPDGGADFAGSTPQLGWTANGATSFTIAGSDITPPVVQSITLVGSPAANSTSISFTITFNESVNNVSADDFQLTTTGNVTGTIGTPSASSGTSMTIPITVTGGAGTIQLTLKSNTNITDATGNGNNTNGYVATYTSSVSHTADLVAPTVSITSSANPTTNLNPIPFTFTFSENVTGFDASDITVINGSAGTVSGSGNSYTSNITPSADGTVTVTVNANRANDAAGNGNTAATQISRISDRTAPTIVSMVPSVGNPTNANSFTLTITFSESVSNFSQGDISVSNCNPSSFSGSGTTYTVTLTPTVSDGTVTASVAGNVANDAAGNGNTASSTFSITVDRTTPSVSITSSVVAATTNTTPIPVTITFSEGVNNFVQGDIVLGNAGISGFTANSASVYTFNLIPSGNGTVTVNVNSNVANDNAGNGNTAATQFSKNFDNVAPTASITSGTTSPTNSTSIPVTVTFSESVTGFDLSDIIVNNGTPGSFSGSGANYSFTITPLVAGTVTANIVGGIAFDAAGNGNSAATQFSITYDNSQPGVSIGSVTLSPTNSNAIPLTFTFTESVSNFISGDVSVSNGNITGFSGSGANYSATLVPFGTGTVTVNINAGVANDAAGNGNTAASQFSIVYDNVAPTVTIGSATTSPTNVASFTVNLTFNESVTNFTINDIAVGNGTPSNFSGSGSSYSVTISPVTDGTVTVNVAANMANDAAGNGNSAASQFSIVSDRNGPSITINSSATSPTNLSSIPLTFTFSEAVTGFDSGDITVLGGSITGFSGSGTTYTANLIPSQDGTVTIFVFQNNALDAAGNGNTFATFSIVSDRTKPTVTISSNESSPTSANPIPITFNFSENTTNFVVGDITFTGGSLSNFSGSGSTYTVDFIPSGNGPKTVRLQAGVMSDAAGNTNNASATFSIFYVLACSQTTTWNGDFWTGGDPIPNQPAVISGNYDSSVANPGGFSACSLVVQNGAHVSIAAGDVITISGNVSVASGSTLTFQSGSNLNAGTIASAPVGTIVFESGSNLIQSGSSNNNLGSITYKRNTSMRRLDYTYWSSPVVDQNLKLFSPMTVSTPLSSSRFYEYNETTNSYVILNALTTSFSAAKGYMIRAPNDFTTSVAPWTGIFTGVPHNGNYSIPVTANNSKFNMIGNPYPSTINADSFLNTPGNEGTIYFWTHLATGDTNGASNYATYNTSGGVAAAQGGPQPNGTIQAGQGFLLSRISSGTVTFTNSMRVNNTDNQFYRSANESPKSRIWLNLSKGTTAMNQMLVAYIDGATLLEDASMDGKLIATGSSLSSLINTDKYVIQARPTPFMDNDIVSLHFNAAEAGTYTISLDHLDGLFADQNVYLRDNQTGIVTDIKQSVYEFASVEGSFANRFEIIYQNTTLGIENPSLNPDKFIVYKEGQALKINSGNTVMESYKIFDIRGRLLHQTNNVNSTTATINSLVAQQQVVLLQITSVDQQTVTKKIVY